MYIVFRHIHEVEIKSNKSCIVKQLVTVVRINL